MKSQSVGGQKCISEKIDFQNLSKNFGFKKYLVIDKYSEIEKNIKLF